MRYRVQRLCCDSQWHFAISLHTLEYCRGWVAGRRARNRVYRIVEHIIDELYEPIPEHPYSDCRLEA